MKKVVITIPCYNEEFVLERTATSVLDYAEKYLADFDWKLCILDNNSSDATGEIAQRIKTKRPDQVLVGHVSIPGRGAALRIAWAGLPGYDIYTYIDADLSTDMKDFRTLIEKVSGGYDLVTGSRYLPESNTERSFLRRFLSERYNWLLKVCLRVSFRDAQCGFKAMSAKLVHELLPHTTDNGWFWDTEVMILACRRGYRVLEVPVAWREARDELRKSTVAVYTEVFRNLRNIYRMYRRLNVEQL